MGNTPINVYFIKKQTPKQSLQADQGLYNRKGVCYIVHVIGRFQVIRRLYLLIRDRKYTKNINNSSQNQYKSYPNSPET